MPNKKKKSTEKMFNQQSAARSTSRTKQHKLVPTRPLALDRQTTTTTKSGTSATTKHAIHTPPIFLQRVFLGKNTPNDAILGRMHATHCFLPWMLSTYYDLRVAQLNNRRNDYFPLFLCRKYIPFFLVHPPPMPYSMSQTKNMSCVIKHRCV